MAMVNIGNISAVTTRMLGNDLGGAVASGVSTLLQSGGSESLSQALHQLENFFGPQTSARVAGGALPSGPMAFSKTAGPASSLGAASALSNPFGATQGLQPKMHGLIEGLSKTLNDMLGKMDTLGEAQRGLVQPGPGAGAPESSRQFQQVMDHAIKLHLSGNPSDMLKSQALFQRALGMLSGAPEAAPSDGVPVTRFTGAAGSPGGGFATPFSSGAGFAPAGGSGGVGGNVSGAGGGLDAMMAQAESLLRSDSMEAQLAGQRLMQKALRMFELISKLIEKQSEMASKAIAAIK